MGAAPIGPGDYVECVYHGGLGSPLTVGSIYTVAKVLEEAGTTGFWLNEVVPPPRYTGFLADLFKPVYRRDESLTARLLSGIPADVPTSPEEVVA